MNAKYECWQMSNAAEEPTAELLWTSTLQKLHAVFWQLSCKLLCNLLL